MANSHEREEFSKRLKQAWKGAGWEIPSAMLLMQEFNRCHDGRKITHQAVQKWLNGESFPTQDKLRTLAGLLKVKIAWLQYGEGKESLGTTAHDASNAPYGVTISDRELLRRYRKLTERQQQAVVEIITALAAKDTRR